MSGGLVAVLLQRYVAILLPESLHRSRLSAHNLGSDN